MPNYDLSSANLGRVANQDVDMLRIADQIVWQASNPDGPYYLNDGAGVTPGSFNDGTPNIVISHLIAFHNDGFVTGLQWYDATSSAGNWELGIRAVTTLDGNKPITGVSKLASATVAATGSGLRESAFDTPVAVSTGQMYLVSRYSATGYYVHSSSFVGHHGDYTDEDPVYMPGYVEDASDKVPGWTHVIRSLFLIGGGDVVPTEDGSGAYYGVFPIFFKSL